MCQKWLHTFGHYHLLSDSRSAHSTGLHFKASDFNSLSCLFVVEAAGRDINPERISHDALLVGKYNK